jgi:DDE family transposase
MQQDSLLPFDLPAVACKKVSVAFDGGMLSSDADVLLLRDVERRQGIAARLAACLSDHRDPNPIDHTSARRLELCFE